MKRALLVAAVVAAGAGSVAATHAASARVPACPGHAPKPASQGAATKHFVRSGATAMRLCRYYNVNWGFSQGLWQQRLIRHSATIGHITHSFNKLQEPPRGIFCPRDDGSELLVVFSYPNAAPERVVVQLSGCRFAMNGSATRTTTAHLRHRLIHLVKSR